MKKKKVTNQPVYGNCRKETADIMKMKSPIQTGKKSHKWEILKPCMHWQTNDITIAPIAIEIT